jgi:hypothetical protein
MFSEKFSERIVSKGRFSLETSASFEINYTDKALWQRTAAFLRLLSSRQIATYGENMKSVFP